MQKVEMTQQGMAGTAESSDIQVTISKNTTDTIEIELTSSVEKQFGETIRAVITQTLENLGIKSAKVVAVDQGALDCTIIARTTAAVHRAANITENFDWEAMKKWNV